MQEAEKLTQLFGDNERLNQNQNALQEQLKRFEEENSTLKQRISNAENEIRIKTDECNTKLSEADSDHRKHVQELLDMVNSERMGRESNLKEVRVLQGLPIQLHTPE